QSLLRNRLSVRHGRPASNHVRSIPASFLTHHLLAPDSALDVTWLPAMPAIERRDSRTYGFPGSVYAIQEFVVANHVVGDGVRFRVDVGSGRRPARRNLRLRQRRR